MVTVTYLLFDIIITPVLFNQVYFFMNLNSFGLYEEADGS